MIASVRPALMSRDDVAGKIMFSRVAKGNDSGVNLSLASRVSESQQAMYCKSQASLLWRRGDIYVMNAIVWLKGNTFSQGAVVGWLFGRIGICTFSGRIFRCRKGVMTPLVLLDESARGVGEGCGAVHKVSRC